MTSEDDFNKEDILFDDIGDLNQLDFGGQSEKQVEENIEYVEDNLWGKLEKTGKRISFAKDIFALYRYMKDPFVKWYRKSIVVAALVYFIVPIDTIPDLTPLFGYLDDLGVITALLKYLGSELMSYYPSGYRT
ncbi:MAG: DUF1232 domain-containing protein [Ignavibacteria bacterium]|nr:DUF1232 domain-containing protein [Ignavibacteria bacterium]MBT8383563.1 DUF1232 domain-containing protein [Ignavibacteria bacterium]NNJ52587.1 DUF1232 domain-containing protein [Ignavibacteriaceae bacterium]NNL22568.1 DUF1232 domain-containing protein [Ignavibacteriaceae bacterium]